MSLDEIRKLVADDLRRVDQVVVARLASDMLTTMYDAPGIGRLCIGGGSSGVLRLSPPLPSWPRAELVIGTSSVPGLPGGFLPGTTWNFQAYYYGVGTGASLSGFTNALSVSFE